MSTKAKQVPQNPLILRCHRLIEAFAKSDDERDFYLDKLEGFLLYVDLDKTEEELRDLTRELRQDPNRFSSIPKMTFYEVKKLMEGFVNEKVYDIDTKEKLLDIIQSKEARENFLEFIYDHHSELEKWQQYYQERFRVRIIEWLRNMHLDFVFEEDIELPKGVVEKLKINIFTAKVPKDLLTARKALLAKAKTYYSNEALNPRPKRGRPPKQVAKVEQEPQFSQDIYIGVSKAIKPFLFAPEYQGTSSIFTFSDRFASEADLLAHKRQTIQTLATIEMQSISQKLATLRTLSSHWLIDHKDEIKNEPSSIETFTPKEAPKAPLAAPAAKIPEKPKAIKPVVAKTFEKPKSVKSSPKKVFAPPTKAKKIPPKKFPPPKKSPPPKIRLRPLEKKKPPLVKSKAVKKSNNSKLRHLRPTKKK
jgi:hypothetical protein